MKPIENVAIVGFGSLGAMYAACFGAAMGPERVFVVADAARTERYRAEAATFNGEPIRVTYLTYEEAAERAAVQPFAVVRKGKPERVFDRGEFRPRSPPQPS